MNREWELYDELTSAERIEVDSYCEDYFQFPNFPIDYKFRKVEGKWEVYNFIINLEIDIE